MWRELIQTLVSTAAYPVEMQYMPGVSKAQETLLESELGLDVPADLKSLLQESDGIGDQYGSRFIWSLEEIIQYNLEMRTLPEYSEHYMSFADMFFFADAGNGDRFAFPIIQGKVRQNKIFAWDHEDDTRKVVAYSLKSYFERSLGGQLKI